MLKPIQTAIFASVTILAFTASSVQANDWFEQQRSMSDGSDYSTHDFAGVQGKSGSTSINGQQSSWLEQQLSISDGYAQPGTEAESAFQGASLERYPNESFFERGRRITDGTTE